MDEILEDWMSSHRGYAFGKGVRGPLEARTLPAVRTMVFEAWTEFGRMGCDPYLLPSQRESLFDAIASKE
jgi:hypothetical protein